MIIQSLQYHQQSSYKRNALGGHPLDWNNQPSVFKSYPGERSISLSDNASLPDLSLSGILMNSQVLAPAHLLQESDLSQILRLTCSLTAKAATSIGPFYYRSVASAGALYPTELYLAALDLQGIGNGLYHYSIAQQGLTPLREGHFGSFLKGAAQWPEGFHPGLTFFISVIFFRSSWKYRDRAFRYHLLDTGHLLENLLLALKAQKLPWALTYDFDDNAINHFLGLDSTGETVLALVSLPDYSKKEKPATLPIPDLDESFLKASRVALKEEAYPIIQALVQSGCERSAQSVPLQTSDTGISIKRWISLKPVDPWPEKINYPAAVLTRRSKRNFIMQLLPLPTFQAMLDGISAELSESRHIPENSDSSITIGVLIGQVEGFTPGFYLLDRKSFQLGLVQEGSYLTPMAKISLDQMWLAQAGFHMLFISDLAALDGHQGPRGYRYSLMSAGRLGERLYLLATAMGLGCCGIGAFYDQEAAELLGLDENNRLVYFLAVGVVKK
jgi:SagB-type dehydrogenase family enzyme